MGKITKKYVGSNQIGSTQIRLENNTSLKARNFADSADVDLMELDPSDLLQMLSHPYLPGDATAALQASSKQQVILRDGTQAMTAALDMGTNLISNVTNPVGAQDAATKDYVDNAIPVVSGKANVNLDNLAAGDTSIPAGTDLRSLEVDQVTGFRVFTQNQTTSVSGSASLRSGSVESTFASGGVQITSGVSTNATGATPTTAVTGFAGATTGTVSGTQGSSGLAFLSTGAISLGVTGNSGLVVVTSGNNAGTGTSGLVTISTGYATTASSGLMLVGTGKALTAASGAFIFSTGGINNSVVGGTIDNSTNNSSTGAVNINSGDVGTGAGASTATTGAMNLRTGNSLGLGATGTVSVLSGNITNAASTAATGNLNLNSGDHAGNGVSGNVSLRSGLMTNATGTAVSGNVTIFSGNHAGLAATGSANLQTGLISNTASAANTGNVNLLSGNNAGDGNSGNANVTTGGLSKVTGLGATGNINITAGSNAGTGATGQLLIRSGHITNATSSANTGDVNIYSGDTSGSGDSGNIEIATGTSGSGVRGIVSIDGLHISVNSKQIKDLADPTLAQDAATKAYVDAQITEGIDCESEKITLSAGDITNQYVDLAFKALLEGVSINVDRVSLNATAAVDADYDFEQDNSGAVTRLIFQGPSATGGAEELVAGQVLFIKYIKLS